MHTVNALPGPFTSTHVEHWLAHEAPYRTHTSASIDGASSSDSQYGCQAGLASKGPRQCAPPCRGGGPPRTWCRGRWAGTWAAPPPCSLSSPWPAAAHGPPTRSRAHAGMARRGLNPALPGSLVRQLSITADVTKRAEMHAGASSTGLHLAVHLPHARQAVVQVIAALWADVDVVSIERGPMQKDCCHVAVLMQSREPATSADVIMLIASHPHSMPKRSR